MALYLIVLWVAMILLSTTSISEVIYSSSSDDLLSSSPQTRRKELSLGKFVHCCGDLENLLACTKKQLDQNHRRTTNLGRIAIVSSGTSEFEDVFKYSFFINAVYSDLHGFKLLSREPKSSFLSSSSSYQISVEVARLVNNPKYDKRWLKVTELKLLFDEIFTQSRDVQSFDGNDNDGKIPPPSPAFEYVVWVDADLIFVDFDFNIESIINMHPDSDIIACQDGLPFDGNNLINTGAMIIRVSEWSRTFISHWWGGGNIHAHVDLVSKYKARMGDQTHFNDMYSDDRYLASEHITVLPANAFNSDVPFWMSFRTKEASSELESSKVLHLMGTLNSVRTTVFKTAFDNICGLSASSFSVVGRNEEDFYDDANFEVEGAGNATALGNHLFLSSDVLRALTRDGYFVEVEALHRAAYGRFSDPSYKLSGKDLKDIQLFLTDSRYYLGRLFPIFIYEYYYYASESYSNSKESAINFAKLQSFEWIPFANYSGAWEFPHVYDPNLARHCAVFSNDLEILLLFFDCFNSSTCEYYEEGHNLQAGNVTNKISYLDRVMRASKFLCKCPIDMIDPNSRIAIMRSLLRLAEWLESLVDAAHPGNEFNKKQFLLEIATRLDVLVSDDSIATGNKGGIEELMTRYITMKATVFAPIRSFNSSALEESTISYEDFNGDERPTVAENAADVDIVTTTSGSIYSDNGIGYKNIEKHRIINVDAGDTVDECFLSLDTMYEAVKASLFSDREYDSLLDFHEMSLVREKLRSCKLSAFADNNSISFDFYKYSYRIAYLNASYYKIFGFPEEFEEAMMLLESLLIDNRGLEPLAPPISDIRYGSAFRSRFRSIDDIIGEGDRKGIVSAGGEFGDYDKKPPEVGESLILSKFKGSFAKDARRIWESREEDILLTN